jgi:hypothetical protein
MPRKRKVKPATGESAWVEPVKKFTIIAIFCDEVLLKRFVLKGGNAMDLIFKVSSRASMDIDLSMSDDFDLEELKDVSIRISRGLPDVFRPEGITPFDIILDAKPGHCLASRPLLV